MAPADHNKSFYANLTENYSTPSHPGMHYTSTIYGSTDDCISSTSDTLKLSDVIAGGWVDGETTITNTLGESVTFTNESWDYFTPGTTNPFAATNIIYPFTLAIGESKTVKFHLQTQTSSKTYGYINYSGIYNMHYTSSDASCTSRKVQLLGRAVLIGDTTGSNLKLFPSQTELLPIKSNKQTTTPPSLTRLRTRG